LDYHPLNVMADGARITGVLDWTNARAGDPRADLARTFGIVRVSPLAPGTPVLPALVARRALELGWRRGYRQAAEGGGTRGGISLEEEQALFYAWAGTVMARDLAPKIGRPGVWLQPHHLERIRRWAARCKRRAGIPD
jgi:aminoglycoside phosphotransferase (APT) family kinase protein